MSSCFCSDDWLESVDMSVADLERFPGLLEVESVAELKLDVDGDEVKTESEPDGTSGGA